MDRFEKLEVLRAAAWESFSSRRNFEWKVNFSLWGLLAALIAGMASEKIDHMNASTAWIVSISAVILGISHAYWQVGVFRAHGVDKEEEGRFREAMRAEIGFEDDPGIVERRKNAIESRKQGIWHWNIVPISCTTLVLVVITIVVAAEKTNSTHNDRHAPSATTVKP